LNRLGGVAAKLIQDLSTPFACLANLSTSPRLLDGYAG
jgi:hypothetical protein